MGSSTPSSGIRLTRCQVGDNTTETDESPNERSDKRIDYSAADDNRLLALIADAHDRLALTELYTRYNLPIRHFLARRMCDPKLIDEIYNDVMLTVWKNAANFRGDSKVSTWLFGIAFRTRQTHSRKENRHSHAGTDELLTNLHTEDDVEIDTQASVRDTIHAALDGLSEQHREVVELAYFHGYSTQEIADIVGCPQNTVKTRLFHARKKLRTIIEDEQDRESLGQGGQNQSAVSDSAIESFGSFSLRAIV